MYWVRREATFALGALAKVIPEELLYTSLVGVLFPRKKDKAADT